MLTPQEYEEKRQARYERLLAAAEKAEREGQSSLKSGEQMFDHIPMGQPILIGHHSEKRDRNYRERARNKISRGYEYLKKAESMRERAQAIENNQAIFSDDPLAVEKLGGKIVQLEARQERMKATNAAIRKGDRDALMAMGHAEHLINRWLDPAPMPWPGKGYPAFEITNNGANIRRLKERAERVDKQQSTPDKDEQIGDVLIEWRASENRIRVIYPSRVDRPTFDKLRQHGYRAMKEAGTFSAYYNGNAAYFVKELRELAAK